MRLPRLRPTALRLLLAASLAASGCVRWFEPGVNPDAVRTLRKSIDHEFDRLVNDFDQLDARGDLELCAPIAFAVARFAVYQAVEERRHADMAQLARFMTRAVRAINVARSQLNDKQCVDSDGDGLTDLDEVRLYRTDPHKADTDRDRLSDGEEVRRYKTNPLKADTDGDLLDDGEEVIRGTSPLLTDSDGDGYPDGMEVAAGSRPDDPCSQPARGERRPGPWTKCRSGKITYVEPPARALSGQSAEGSPAKSDARPKFKRAPARPPARAPRPSAAVPEAASEE